MKKNILYIFADQWKKTAIGFENAQIPTKHMDEFAKECKVFDNAISSYPLCSPHRAALMTGKYPYSCGMWTNCKIGLDEIVMLKPQEETIGKVLKKAGYATAYIGKWHLDASEENFTKEPKSGARHWDAYTPPSERRQGFDFWYSYGAMDHHLTPHYWNNTPNKINCDRWSPEVETDIVIDYLNNRDKSKPFSLFVSWNPPHPPYDVVPQKYVDLIHDIDLPSNVSDNMKNDPEYLKTVKEYYGAIAGLDENFGRLIACLKEQGIEDDTIVVLSADHGEMMGAQGLMGKNIWYEESIQIPFMIRGAGIKSGRTDTMFSSMDHMPTLLDLLDCEIPEAVQGKSCKKMLLGEVSKELENLEHVFISMLPGMPGLIEPYRKRGLNNKAFGWRGIRTKDTTYIINNGTHPDEKQERWLYDLKTDPMQMNPMKLKAEDEQCKIYDTMLLKHLNLIKDPFLLERN